MCVFVLCTKGWGWPEPYVYCIWLYIWWFPCQTRRIYTVYIWFWPTLQKTITGLAASKRKCGGLLLIHGCYLFMAVTYSELLLIHGYYLFMAVTYSWLLLIHGYCLFMSITYTWLLLIHGCYLFMSQPSLSWKGSHKASETRVPATCFSMYRSSA